MGVSIYEAETLHNDIVLSRLDSGYVSAREMTEYTVWAMFLETGDQSAPDGASLAAAINIVESHFSSCFT